MIMLLYINLGHDKAYCSKQNSFYCALDILLTIKRPLNRKVTTNLLFIREARKKAHAHLQNQH